MSSASVTRSAILGMLQLALMMSALVFLPAWTVHYPQGWIFLAVFFGASIAVTVYLARHDPALLARRTQAGPMAEKQRTQVVIQSAASLAFMGIIALPALGHRFAWAPVPFSVSLAGDALVALGFAVVFRVFRENTFTSAVIEVAAGQRVVDTGPYAVVRHPMYSGAMVLLAGIPLALGSYVGLAFWPVMLAVIVWRLLREERSLAVELPGYAEYCAKTRWRILPGVF